LFQVNDMTEEHLITPPPELIQEWWDGTHGAFYEFEAVVTQAARWGADEELKACCEWLETYVQRWAEWSADFRADRRPKPPSLKEQALQALDRMDQLPTAEDQHIIRRALEQLND
jgi:hypothetical protein